MVRPAWKQSDILPKLALLLAGPAPLLIGLEEKSRTLIHIPVEESGDDVNLRMSMLWK